MATGAIGHEIEIFGGRGVQHRFQRGAARVGDGPRRQAIDAIGVVAGGRLDVGAGQRPVQPPLAAGDAIDDRRVRLQPHALVQPVDEDRGDDGALFGHRRFLLDDGGKRHRLLLRRDGRHGHPAGPQLFQQPGLCRLHILDQLLARHAAPEHIGIRQDRALGRQCCGRAGEHLAGIDAGHRHLAGEAFGNGDLVGDRPAAGDEGHDLLHGGRRGDVVFAGLEPRALPGQLRQGREDAPVGNDAAPLQRRADFSG